MLALLLAWLGGSQIEKNSVIDYRQQHAMSEHAWIALLHEQGFRESNPGRPRIPFRSLRLKISEDGNAASLADSREEGPPLLLVRPGIKTNSPSASWKAWNPSLAGFEEAEAFFSHFTRKIGPQRPKEIDPKELHY